jgi:exonuclease VII large subunit
VDVFNSCTLAEACLNLTPHLVTAIGHKDDVTLVQRIADRAFITPTALGQFLGSLHDETLEAIQNSKAALVETVTKQLGAQYDGQIRNLTEKLTATEAIHAERAALLTRQLADRDALLEAQRTVAGKMEAQFNAAKKGERPLWLFVLIAALAGVLVGAILGAWMR